MAITGTILNWKRPANVSRILNQWQATKIINEGIVWNNNVSAPFKHDWAKVINAKQDCGLYSRFRSVDQAKNECILIQDDDLIVPLESIQLLLDAWKNEPDILHGIFGRQRKNNGDYKRGNVTGAVPVVLTRILLTDRRYALDFLNTSRNFESIQNDSQPLGNGEDIIFSYSVMKRSGKLNWAHKLPVIELPAPYAIHQRYEPSHYAHRCRLIQACDAWLNGSPSNQLSDGS